jgi:hypothetical protein
MSMGTVILEDEISPLLLAFRNGSHEFTSGLLTRLWSMKLMAIHSLERNTQQAGNYIFLVSHFLHQHGVLGALLFGIAEEALIASVSIVGLVHNLDYPDPFPMASRMLFSMITKDSQLAWYY